MKEIFESNDEGIVVTGLPDFVEFVTCPLSLMPEDAYINFLNKEDVKKLAEYLNQWLEEYND